MIDWAQVITAIVVLLVTTIGTWLWREVAKTRTQVSELWDAALARGPIEAVTKGRAQWHNNDVAHIDVHDAAVRKVFEPILPELRKLWRENRSMSPNEFGQLVLRNHKQFLLEEVCRPLGLHDLGCVALAVALAQEECEECA